MAGVLLRRCPFFVTSWRRVGISVPAGTRDRSHLDPPSAFTDKMPAFVWFPQQYWIQTGSILSTEHGQSWGTCLYHGKFLEFFREAKDKYPEHLYWKKRGDFSSFFLFSVFRGFWAGTSATGLPAFLLEFGEQGVHDSIGVRRSQLDPVTQLRSLRHLKMLMLKDLGSEWDPEFRGKFSRTFLGEKSPMFL